MVYSPPDAAALSFDAETIDVSGALADGRNDIQITSDSLGEPRAALEYEAIKNADSR